MGASSSIRKEAKDFAERQIQIKYQGIPSKNQFEPTSKPARMYRSASWDLQSEAGNKSGFEMVKFGKSRSFLELGHQKSKPEPLSLPVVNDVSTRSRVSAGRDVHRLSLDSLRMSEFLPPSTNTTNLSFARGK